MKVEWSSVVLLIKEGKMTKKISSTDHDSKAHTFLGFLHYVKVNIFFIMKTYCCQNMQNFRQ